MITQARGATVQQDRRATVVIYPAPEEEAVSSDYAVEVNDQPLHVYTARVNDPPFEHLDYGGTYSFVSFDFQGQVTVKIRSLDGLHLQTVGVEGGPGTGPEPHGTLDGVLMQSARVLPLSRGIRHALVDERTTTLTIDQPGQLVFEPRGKKSPLLIFANPTEVDPPAENDPGVLYFGPGVHRPEGGIVRVESNQTLYLSGGAVLQAALLIEDAENVTIRGRGILCGNAWRHLKGPLRWFVNLNHSRNILLEGIILRGAYAWTLVPGDCDGVTIRNIKICGGRVWNDDGVNPCNSRHVVVQDCFIRTDDDCFAPKGMDLSWGDVVDFRAEHCILWCDRARVVLLGHESRASRMADMLWRDIDVLHYVQKVFLFEPGEEMVLENVRLEDWRIQGEGQGLLAVIRPTVNQYMHTKVPGHIRNVQFKDITVFGRPGACQVIIEGCDDDHRVEDVLFENVTVLGEPLAADPSRIVIGDERFVEGIRFV